MGRVFFVLALVGFSLFASEDGCLALLTRKANFPDRASILQSAGINRGSLSSFFDGVEQEHDMVALTMDSVCAAEKLTGAQKAAYWEELCAVIEAKIGRPVSQSHRGVHEGKEIYIFQGRKRFEGKAYVLVVLEDGSVFSGRGEPIDELGNWSGRLDELKKQF